MSNGDLDNQGGETQTQGLYSRPPLESVLALWNAAQSVVLPVSERAFRFLEAERKLNPSILSQIDLFRCLPPNTPCPAWAQFGKKTSFDWALGWPLLVPLSDAGGNFVALKGRAVDPLADPRRKSLNMRGFDSSGLVILSPQGRLCFAGQFQPSFAVLVEGEMDLAVWEERLARAAPGSDLAKACIVGITSGSCTPMICGALLRLGCPIYFRFHPDAAGVSYTVKFFEGLRALKPDCELYFNPFSFEVIAQGGREPDDNKLLQLGCLPSDPREACQPISLEDQPPDYAAIAEERAARVREALARRVKTTGAPHAGLTPAQIEARDAQRSKYVREALERASALVEASPRGTSNNLFSRECAATGRLVGEYLSEQVWRQFWLSAAPRCRQSYSQAKSALNNAWRRSERDRQMWVWPDELDGRFEKGRHRPAKGKPAPPVVSTPAARAPIPFPAPAASQEDAEGDEGGDGEGVFAGGSAAVPGEVEAQASEACAGDGPGAGAPPDELEHFDGETFPVPDGFAKIVPITEAASARKPRTTGNPFAPLSEGEEEDGPITPSGVQCPFYVLPNGEVAERTLLLGVDVSAIIETAELHMSQARPDIYQRHGRLCYVMMGKKMPEIKGVLVASMLEILGDSTIYLQRNRAKPGEDAPSSKYKRVHPPKYLQAAVLNRTNFSHVPDLRLLSEHPLIDISLDPPKLAWAHGFHKDLGILNTGRGVRSTDEPRVFTREAALAALDRLGVLIQNFPFATESHKTCMFMYMLLPMVRGCHDGPCPLVLVEAAQKETGKTFLVDMVSRIYSGHDAPQTAPDMKQEELYKQLITIATNSYIGILNFDNLKNGSTFGSSMLDSILTGGIMMRREMATHNMSAVEFRAIIAGTGNNITLQPDTIRRVIPIRLKALDVEPHEREFAIPDLNKHIAQNRTQILSDIATIILAWIHAGSPGRESIRFGSYQALAEITLGPLYWLGRESIVEARAELDTRSNPEQSALIMLLEALEALRVGTFSSPTLHRTYGEARDKSDRSEHEQNLLVACEQLGLYDKGKWSRYRATTVCAANQDRWFGPLRLEVVTGGLAWRVVRRKFTRPSKPAATVAAPPASPPTPPPAHPPSGDHSSVIPPEVAQAFDAWDDDGGDPYHGV